MFPEPDCITSIRWAQLRVTFSCEKKKGPKCSLLRFVAIIWTQPGPEHYLCSEGRVRAELYPGCRSGVDFVTKRSIMPLPGIEFRSSGPTELLQTKRNVMRLRAPPGGLHCWRDKLFPSTKTQKQNVIVLRNVNQLCAAQSFLRSW
jgi:hypothetical protein